MSDTAKTVLGFFIGVVILMVLTGIYWSGYRNGQVDALTGHIEYEKVTHRDSTVTWESIKE